MAVGSETKGKTISQAQITGEHGVALAKERTHAMGFLFTPYGPVEGGIDALIEIRDPVTGQIGGRLVAVQVKSRDNRPYTAESDDRFEYLCDAVDLTYWQSANVPVIVVLVRLSDRSVYWKQIPKSGVVNEETRRLVIDKNKDRFDLLAANALIQLSIDQSHAGVWLPPSRQPEGLFLNAVKVALPQTIDVAITAHRQGRDALKALLEMDDHPPSDWIARGGRLVTFLDIEKSLLRNIVDQGSIERLPVSEFSLQDDEDDKRLFVELLNRTLRAQLDPLLVWNKTLKLLYFPPDGAKVDRTIRYSSFRNETTRAVVKSRRKANGTISYVRHCAFYGRFWREFDEWYLTIEPTYVFTRDGTRPDRFAGERISKLKRLENNAAIRGQFLMWRALLTGSGASTDQSVLPLAGISAPILRFTGLEPISVPLSLPDELWRSRDVDAPDDDDEELPL